jgi:hypothetical protein
MDLFIEKFFEMKKKYKSLVGYLKNLFGLPTTTSILAQQPGGVRAFPFGISSQICFFSKVGLSHQCLESSFT